MKITSLIANAVLASVGTADARPRPHGFGGKRFEANKTFGLGLELGEPTGLNGKLFLQPDQAIDFGVGDIYHHYYGGDGGRTWFFDYGCPNGPNNVCNGAEAFGIRVPLGVSFDLNTVPLDIFIQLVPTLDFFRDYAPHNVYLDVDFSVGIRYWFS